MSNSDWIVCSNGALLNKSNIIMLKAHKAKGSVVAECVGNRTVDIEQCEDYQSAQVRCNEIAGIPVEKPKPKPKPKVQQKKPAAKK